MEISRTKVLIYALTFLGYAFSGYGSGVVESIRDAVIFAEEYFGQFLKNAVHLVKTLGEAYRLLQESDDNCRFSCPSGATPVKNVRHKPSYNGCGSDVIIFQILNYIPVSGMRDCCITYDRCYETCNKLKRVCDDEFKKCLYHVCDQMGTLGSRVCRVAAFMVSSTMSFGCRSYLHSQKKCCYCPDEDDKKGQCKRDPGKKSNKK